MPDSIGDILKTVLVQPDPLKGIRAKWTEVVGALSEHTTVTAYLHGDLIIEANTSSVIAELHARTAEIIAGMGRGEKAVLVRRLKFRIGGRDV